MRKIISVFLLMFAVLSASADAGGFYYKNIKYEAVVHKNNVWDVKETFDIVYNEPRHGFYRYIPESFHLQHVVDGELNDFYYCPSIYNIDVPDYNFELEEENDNQVIKIGSEYELVNGEKSYVITYNYQYPDDRLRTKDYLFHTILGTDFAEPIGHFSFSIKFDKALPASVKKNLKALGGEYGSTETIDNVKFSVTGNTISGSADSIMPNHGLTLYCDLPEGYYEGVEVVSDTPMMIFIIISIVLAAIIIALALTRRHSLITKQIEFYPPEGISSAEVGTIIDSTVDPVDMASLIPWFASKGYLTIKEIEEKGIFRKSTVLEITKRNAMPQDAPQYQRIFMDALFGEKNTVRLDELEEQPEMMKDAKSAIEGLYTGTKGTESDHSLMYTSYWIWLYVPLVICSTIAMGLSSQLASVDEGNMAMSALLWGIPLATLAYLYHSLKKGEKVRSKTLSLVFNLIIVLAVVAGLMLLNFMYVDCDHHIDSTLLLILFVACFGSAFMAGRFINDTPFRVQMLGKLLGLKEFIETAEKPRLESLLEDDPEYFYKIMPYAMVFNLTDKWADQFKGINMERPTWYDATSFNTFYFAHSMNTLCSSATDAITTVSHDSSSASGGAFGGGFSGGGGGGGGGGSW